MPYTQDRWINAWNIYYLMAFGWFVCLLLNIWGHIAMVSACSSDTWTNVLPHRNVMPQTQDTTPVTVYRHGADLKQSLYKMYIYASFLSRMPLPSPADRLIAGPEKITSGAHHTMNRITNSRSLLLNNLKCTTPLCQESSNNKQVLLTLFVWV